VIAAYEKHHASGLEILGISLDSESSKEKLPAFIQEKHIQWPQVCDGLGWKAAIGQLYNVHSIPATFLIDGDSGKVIAVGIRGAALEPAIAKALTEKAR
jgi:peroxiredoxin